MSIAPKKQRACSAGTAAAGGPESLLQPDSTNNPTWDCNYRISYSLQQKNVLIPALHVIICSYVWVHLKQ
jgi:hypothetical protein